MIGDDDEDADSSDWLSHLFDPTEQIPKQSEPAEPAPAEPRPVTPPAPASEPEAPAQAGGFNWNLRPRAVQTPPPEPSVAEPVEAPVSNADIPTQAMEIPTQAMEIPTEAMEIPTQAMEIPAADIPTQAMEIPVTPPAAWDPFATRSGPIAQPDSAADGPPTEAYTVPPWMPAPSPVPIEPIEQVGYVPPQPAFPTAARDPNDPTSAIDSLFGENKFQEYEEVGLLPIIPGVAAPPSADQPFGSPEVQRAPLTSTQKALLWAAGGLVAALALVLLFMLGTKLGAASATTATVPTTAPSSGATASPSTTPEGLAAPGVRSWNALKGGECIQPFTSAWAATFTVVDCTADHHAQMIVKGTLKDASGSAYPTGAEFAMEITPLCTAPTAINYSIAGRSTDIQLSFSYPPNQNSWSNGDRTYYCFVTRESGNKLPGNLAIPKK